MTSMRVIWPKTGLRRSDGLILGLRVNDVVVVVAIVAEWLEQRARQYPDLVIVGSTSRLPDCSAQSISFALEQGVPVASYPAAQIILFEPPDPRRLRYLTTGTGVAEDIGLLSPLEGQDGYGVGPRRSTTAGLDSIIPLLNDVRRLQRELYTTVGLGKRDQIKSGHSSIVSLLGTILAPLACLLRIVLWSSRLPLPGTKDLSVSKYSSTFHQLSLRARQVLDGPRAFRQTLYKPSVPLHIRSRQYVKFWNTVWLILNDLLLGYCAAEVLKQLGSVICSAGPDVFQVYTVHWIISALVWLDDWPVGLKLNTPLSRCFRIGFSMIVDSWGGIIHPALQAYLSSLLYIMSLSGYGGFTLSLSLARDTLALLTLHLRICHEITSLLVRWQLSSLGGLWNLFRGKKWNVLRQRTDSYAYDVDQLFLGTLLFTVSAFLLPTVVTYAALFASIRLTLWTVDKVLEIVTNGLNAFPLFEVLLRVKEPSRLPYGVIFDLKPGSKGDSCASMLEIRNAPRPLASILFRQARTLQET